MPLNVPLELPLTYVTTVSRVVFALCCIPTHIERAPLWATLRRTVLDFVCPIFSIEPATNQVVRSGCAENRVAVGPTPLPVVYRQIL